MDELSPLFQEIEFHERFRGYDPDEVDAYVDRVAKAAALAQGEIDRVLEERVEAAEARGAAMAVTETEETLARTLVLAQRTADAAIAEAQEEAERLTSDAHSQADAMLSGSHAEAQVTLREAEAEASRLLTEAEAGAVTMVTEAEAERDRLVSEAEAVAAQAASTERARLAGEVAELQQQRGLLSDDVEILERHLAEQRHHLAASLATISELVESPELFRTSPPPAISGVEPDVDIDIDLAAVVPDPAEAADELTADEIAADIAAEFVSAEPSVAETLDEVASDAAAPDVVDDDVAGVAVAPQPRVVATSDEMAESDVGPAVLKARDEFEPVVDLREHDGEVTIDLDEPDVAPQATDTAGRGPSRLVTAADLDVSATALAAPDVVDADVDIDDAGPATAPIPAIEEASLFAEPPSSDEDSFLAQLRDAVAGDQVVAPATDDNDDALTAFFDQGEEDDGRSWFGRRR